MDIAGHIGTPLTTNATKVLLLGAGELGKGLAMAFQHLGVEVHAVDRYEGAPALQVAHFSYVADICDDDKVLELVTEIKPDYVVPEVWFRRRVPGSSPRTVRACGTAQKALACPSRVTESLVPWRNSSRQGRSWAFRAS